MISDQLKQLKKPLFTTDEARQVGVSPRMLSHYAQKGDIQRISHGVYGFPDSLGFDLESIIREKLAAIPQAIVGLTTALRLFDLTEEHPPEIDLIVPLSNTPKRKLKDVRFYQVKDEIYRLGITDLNGLPVTTLERTIIDFLRQGKSLAFVLEIFAQAKAKRLAVDLPKLKQLAKTFRVKRKLEMLMDALV